MSGAPRLNPEERLKVLIVYADRMGSERLPGAARVIYGSDCGRRNFASLLDKVHSAKISDADKQKIFRDNLCGLMLPILKAKGIKA